MNVVGILKRLLQVFLKSGIVQDSVKEAGNHMEVVTVIVDPSHRRDLSGESSPISPTTGPMGWSGALRTVAVVLRKISKPLGTCCGNLVLSTVQVSLKHM
jgi:hypothetical protein